MLGLLKLKCHHIETVSSYDTCNFLNAFKRFVSRRGLCSHVYSDCGTNFVGADAQLKLMFSQQSRQANEIIADLAKMGIQWHFNPPAAPHFGGLLEAAIRSTKFHLKRVIGETSLSYEEMSTLLNLIEAYLNSRPLTPLTDDISDFQVLAPAHFLIGRSLISLPDYLNYNENINLLQRWRLITKIRDDFWSVWHKVYLQSLQPRSKWLKENTNIAKGSMVLIKYENVPPTQWPLARVIEPHAGKVGLVRTATLKTPTTQLDRPIAKLILLPIDST